MLTLSWEWVALTEVDSIPDAMASCLAITQVDLRRNQLSGAIPGCMSIIGQTIVQIVLGYNKLSGTIPSAFAFFRIDCLWLDHNKFSGSVPDLEVVSETGIGGGFKTY